MRKDNLPVSVLLGEILFLSAIRCKEKFSFLSLYVSYISYREFLPEGGWENKPVLPNILL